MSDHSKALVPIEAWAFNSPELKIMGKSIDVGLLAESLIYYDSILLNVGTPYQFNELISWLIKTDSLNDFLDLVDEGAITFYEYAFMSTAVNKDGIYSLWNVQDSLQSEPNSFGKKYLYTEEIDQLIPKARHRNKLYDKILRNAIEVKADDFGPAIENARLDYDNKHRHETIVQELVNEIYKINQLKEIPKTEAEITKSDGDTKTNIRWNIDMKSLNSLSRSKLQIGTDTPLVALAHSNRLLFSASQLSCDLYLSSPMSLLIGDKIAESGIRLQKNNEIIDELITSVEFPDIRYYLNNNKISLKDVIEIRKKSKRFRSWLQDESERDRDAIISYHHEVAKELRIIGSSRKLLSMFGIIGGSAIGAVIGASMTGTAGSAIGGAAGSAIGYLLDIASKLGSDWKPVVFGNWSKERIERLLKNK